MGFACGLIISLFSRTRQNALPPPSREDRIAPVVPIQVDPVTPPIAVVAPTDGAETSPSSGFKINVAEVNVEHSKNDEENMVVYINCLITEVQTPKTLDAVLYEGIVMNAETTTGQSANILDVPEDINLNNKTDFHFKVGVPATTKSLRSLRGIGRVLHIAKSSPLTWDLTKELGVSKSTEACEVRLSEIERLNDTLRVSVSTRFVKLETDAGADWRPQLSDYKLRCSDDSEISSFSVATPTGRTMSFKLNGKTPVALNASIVSGVEMKGIPFEAHDIELPHNTVAEGRPNAPHAKQTWQAEGYSFAIQNVEVRKTIRNGLESGFLIITLDVSFPPRLNLALARNWMPDAAAIDNTGRLYKSVSQGGFANGPGARFNVTYLDIPTPKADRLTKFTGTFRVALTDERLTQTFPLVENSPPVSKDAVTLKSVVRDHDLLVVTWVFKANFQNPDLSACIKGTIYSKSGSEVRALNGHYGGKPDGNIEYKMTYSLDETQTRSSTLSVDYVTKVHFNDVHVEFKDIEIPSAKQESVPKDF